LRTADAGGKLDGAHHYPTETGILSHMAKKTDYRVERGTPDRQLSFNSNMWGTRTETSRAFAVTTVDYRHQLLEALLIIKKTAAQANSEIGALDQTFARTIGQCCDEILAGQWRDQLQLNALFPDGNSFLQTAVDEVLSNRSLMVLGLPADEVSTRTAAAKIQLNQGSQQVLQLALRISIVAGLRILQNGLLDLERLLRRKSLEYERSNMIANGLPGVESAHSQANISTQLNKFAVNIQRSLKRLNELTQAFLLIGAGGPECGTKQEFTRVFVDKLRTACNIKFQLDASNTQSYLSQTDLIELSSALKVLAVEIQSICQKLRPEVIERCQDSISPLQSASQAQKETPQVIIETILGDTIIAGVVGRGGNDARDAVDSVNIDSNSNKETFYASQEESDAVSKKANFLLPIDALYMAAIDLLGCDAVVTVCTQQTPDEFTQLSPLIAKALLSCIDSVGRSLFVFNIKTLAGLRPPKPQDNTDASSNLTKAPTAPIAQPTHQA
jgi:fumarate hydratase class II